MRCYYEVLELEASCDADAIRKSYRRLALRWHPDKNVGNEEEATARFKEITAAHTVLSDPQERQWYDDHRDAILSGRDTSEEGGGASSSGPLENLWPFFNPMCHNGFDDGKGGFYDVYSSLFERLHNLEVSRGSASSAHAPASFGRGDAEGPKVFAFYNHWSNFVTTLPFGWADVYDPREAQNRFVKRAVDKENKKFRDEARKKYQDQVRALVLFVRKQDPRVARLEAERREAQAQEQARKAAALQEAKSKKKELKQKQLETFGNDAEELERREKERQTAFLLADDSDDGSGRGRRRKGGGHATAAASSSKSRAEAAMAADACAVMIDDASASLHHDESDSDEVHSDGAETVFRCELCRKDFRSNAQMQQHLVSKIHRKKESEFLKKNGGKAATKKEAQSKKPVGRPPAEEEAGSDEDGEPEDVLVTAIAAQSLDQEADLNGEEDKAGSNIEGGDEHDDDDDDDDYFKSPTTVFGFNKHLVDLTSSSSSEDSDEDR